MSLTICAVYSLVVLLCASLAFVAFTLMWTPKNGRYRGEAWGNSYDVCCRLFATLAGAILGFCYVHLIVGNEDMSALAALILCCGVCVGLALAGAVLAILVILWFKWLHNWAMSRAPERRDVESPSTEFPDRCGGKLH